MTHQFPRLPVLDAICDRVGNNLAPVLATTGIFCIQHVLESTGSLLEALVRLGAQPHLIHVVGKPYSTNHETEQALNELGVRTTTDYSIGGRVAFDHVMRERVRIYWRAMSESMREGKIKRIVILEDGAHAASKVPRWVRGNCHVVAIEQTTAGASRTSGGASVPVVQVALSAAKRRLESPLIAEAVISRVEHRIGRSIIGPRIGVVGYGNIGKALYLKLSSLGCRVVAFDKSAETNATIPEPHRLRSLAELTRNSDIVFGCTGKDIFRNSALPVEVSSAIVLASCSSSDIEFQSLISLIRKSGQWKGGSILDDIVTGDPGKTITILRGGFPVNFDGSTASVPTWQIQMTRGLLLGGVVQALRCRIDRSESPENRVQLDRYLQRFVVRRWLMSTPKMNDDGILRLASKFEQLEWIRRESGGTPLDCRTMKDYFGS